MKGDVYNPKYQNVSKCAFSALIPPNFNEEWNENKRSSGITSSTPRRENQRETNEPECRSRTGNARTGRQNRLSTVSSHKGAKRLYFFLASCRDSCGPRLQVSNTCTGRISTSCKDVHSVNISQSATPATQNDMTTSSDTSRKTRQRHAFATFA